jgi:adenosylcobinamide-GDP ribazoletransferase
MPVANARAAAAALTFLTRVPLGRAIAVNAADVARGSPLFPVVGIAVGGLVGGTALLVDRALPSLAAGAIAVAVGLLVTGAMHLDALADVADAAGGSSSVRSLEIMRDARLGTFGVAAVALDLLLKVVALSALLDRGGVVRAVIAAAALSRAAPLPLAATLPYPRPGGGPGSVLSGRVSRLGAAVGVAVAVGAAVVLEGRTGLVMAATVAGTGIVLGLLYRTWLGGATGDCLGAVIEVGETGALLAAVALS